MGVCVCKHTAGLLGSLICSYQSLGGGRHFQCQPHQHLDSSQAIFSVVDPSPLKLRPYGAIQIRLLLLILFSETTVQALPGWPH